jgi:hypothetical protein
MKFSKIFVSGANQRSQFSAQAGGMRMSKRMKLSHVICSTLIATVLVAAPALADKKHPKNSQVQVEVRSFISDQRIDLELFEVPHNKRLVMQYLSLNGTTIAGSSLNVNCRITVQKFEGDFTTDTSLTLPVISNRNVGFTSFDGHLASGPITMYAGPQDTVVASCNALGFGNEMNSLTATLVGYLDKK